jgi:hypothetical protein
MKRIIVFLFVLYLLLNINTVFAQCSDAGICSLSGHEDMEETTKFRFGVSYYYGYSGKDDEISYHSVKLSGAYNFTENIALSVISPYNSQSGPLGEVNGIGDVIIGLSNIFNAGESMISVSVGAKIGTGDENKDPELPQAYQGGLGSTDVLLAVDYSFSNFTLGAGYQIAGSRNNNAITRLKRGDDLLLRGSYVYNLNDFVFNPQILLIKRMSKSSILDPESEEEKFIEVDKSDQLQINFLLNTTYNISNTYSLFVEAAVPFLKREVNVDGLTRTFSASLGVNVRF